MPEAVRHERDVASTASLDTPGTSCRTEQSSEMSSSPALRKSAPSEDDRLSSQPELSTRPHLYAVDSTYRHRRHEGAQMHTPEGDQ
jgi:hypothetical protein